jgi:hypothetical protein
MGGPARAIRDENHKEGIRGVAGDYLIPGPDPIELNYITVFNPAAEPKSLGSFV